ncbi:putative glycoside hydrolase [Mycoplasmatota bacterium WC44]
MKKSRSIYKIVLLNVLIILIVVFLVGTTESNIWGKNNSSIVEELFVSGDRELVLTYNNLNDLDEVFIPRGTLASALGDETIYGTNFRKISYENNDGLKMETWIESDKLVLDLEHAVLEKEIYVRTTTHIFDSMEDGEFIGLATKGQKFQVLDAELNSNGVVNWYKVKSEEIEGYVRGKYFVLEEASSVIRYADINPLYLEASTRETCGNCFGGSATKLDFFPRNKIKYESNVMPLEVISWYISMENLWNIDEYIKLANDTNVNSFVIDIKDDGTPSYKSDVMKEYSITNYNHAMYSKEEFLDSVKKLKEAGFYVIGRITVFKDAYYAKDHPEYVIADSSTDEPIKINGKYWPSPYIREVWKFNVDLAKESVEKFGFNEINFDYIRFPDRTQELIKGNKLDQRNKYGEERSEAIQRFVMYAYDELSELEVYVSGDVFGEASHNYVADYGQYWPALSNILDVISPMPYPDHFGNIYQGYIDVVKPWEQPYKIMKVWGASAKKSQEETPTPAIVRSWILHQDTMQGYKYQSEHLTEQVRGLYENGLDGGYMPWTALGTLSNYKKYIEFYK